MKALVITAEHKLELQDISIPGLGAYEALVRTQACGICSTTDRELIKGTQPFHKGYPAVLGHEAVGEVVETGTKVTSFAVGNMVTRPVAIWPGEQRDGLYSAWGGFAEYGLVRDEVAKDEAEGRADGADMIYGRAPEGMDVLDAALAISLSELASWMWKLGAVGGRSIAIGGTGLAGYAICLYAKLAGAGPVIQIGRRDERLEYARRFGADVTVNCTTEDVAAAVRDATDGRGADIFTEATGADEVFAMGLTTLRPHGTLAIYGAPEHYRYTLPLRSGPVDFNVRLICPAEQRAYPWVCRQLQSGVIDPMLFRTHVWDGLDKINEAVEAQTAGRVVKGFVRIAQ